MRSWDGDCTGHQPVEENQERWSWIINIAMCLQLCIWKENFQWWPDSGSMPVFHHFLQLELKIKQNQKHRDYLNFFCLKYWRPFSLRHESETGLKFRELSICYYLKYCKLACLACSCSSKRAQLRSHSFFVSVSPRKVSETLSVLRVFKLARVFV